MSKVRAIKTNYIEDFNISESEQQDMDKCMILSSLIYEALKSKGYTIEELAEKTNCPDIEDRLSGEMSLTDDLIINIEKALNVQIKQ